MTEHLRTDHETPPPDSEGRLRPDDRIPTSHHREGGRGIPIRRSAALLLLVAIAAAIGFTYVRGGLPYPLQPSPGRPIAAAATSSPAPSPPDLAATPTMSPSASAPPSPSASADPSPAAGPTATPTAKPSAIPRSDRYAVLRPCQDAPRCWIYTVRSGDNLFSIAHWFGVPLSTVRSMNPWLAQTGLRAGQDLRLPPPTR
jgi:LysM repeat protein